MYEEFEDDEDEFETAKRIAIYKDVIKAAQAALDILENERASEDALTCDVFKFGVVQIAKVLYAHYDMESIVEDIKDKQ